MAKAKSPTYDESSIEELPFPDCIRKRPGMYVGKYGNGKLPDDGIYLILKEVIDNSIDEFRMNCGNQIDIEIFSTEDNLEGIIIQDQGRGIPHGSLITCLTKIHAGGKFDSQAFQKSTGMNGVGMKAVNALSLHMEVTTSREGKSSTATFSQGHLKKESSQKIAKNLSGTKTRFIPDPCLFTNFSFVREYIEKMLLRYACLNTGLTITLKDYEKPEESPKVFHSQRGLIDLLEASLKEGGEDKTLLYPPIVLKIPENPDIEIVITHGSHYGEEILSFVNGQFTPDQGTHVTSFKEGLCQTLRDFFNKKFESQDIRNGLFAALAIRIQDPMFESQTKVKLGSTHTLPNLTDGSPNPKGESLRLFLGNFIKQELDNHLHKNPESAQSLRSKIQQNELERKELSGIREKAKKTAKSLQITNKKLKDCRVHLNSKTKSHQEFRLQTTIFITEGDSASGSITQARNAETQAVFSLKGKPANTFGSSRKAIYENEELHMLVDALGIENDMENLRYNLVILATDADADGMHIRMLAICFFLQYFPELIRNGHLHILQTPLFRIRNRKETRYCYSETEKEKALKALSPNPEITRFKGLGEISPKEFKGFIGNTIRLDPVRIGKETDSDKLLQFYMGENTPERRKFICENLIPDLE